MSHIIWKNQCSENINGLIICSLPPITKPQLRTTITEIDGRDGDIIENLGYKSYDKTISIGLTRNYDLDSIMNYFNGSGQLILSNEPDKYYNAQIIESIDYNKLINFKTAEVKFHVQPYKYSLNEEKVILEITKEIEMKVNNIGLEKSKPIITLYGEGIIDLYVNGLEIFKINIDDEYVVIDSLNEEAYKEKVLKNRCMVGEFPEFLIGENTITWSGNLKKIIVEPKSRWL